MNSTLKRIFTLARICISAPGGKIGLLFCVFVLILNLLGIPLAIKMIAWNKDFFGALEKYDAKEALWQIAVFGILIMLSSLQFLIATYVRQHVQIRWRTGLMNACLDSWFTNKAYWYMNTDENSKLDNPDQRIAEDCRIFVERLVGGGAGAGHPMSYCVLDLFTGIVGLVAYVGLLWQLSAFPISFSFFGTYITIEHYLVWAAPIYVLISSILTHWMGKPLMRLNVVQQHREADMRFALARLRESKEAVALENGEKAEREIIGKRYNRIIENWKHLINREFILGIFTRPYFMSVLRIPLFLAFPAYFAGHVALAGLMQLGAAFQRLITTLSWFIFAYKDMAELAATTNRIANFMEKADEIAKQEQPIDYVDSNDGNLHIRDLIVNNPAGEQLLHLSELTVKAGEAVWIDGPSGLGKTTLLKALSGIWPYCSGHIEMPKEKSVFLPQKAYLPLAGLAECITYPEKPESIEQADKLLKTVGLTCPRHEPELEKNELSGDYRLSGGEQQRLIIARILSAKPKWVFLDEATSSLDLEAENKLYNLLRTLLPDTGFVVIAHREPKGLGNYRHIDLWNRTA